jgi:hypothetical protein
MDLTVDQLAAEAGRMALELRLKDRLIVVLQAENTQLRGALEAAETRRARRRRPASTPAPDPAE